MGARSISPHPHSSLLPSLSGCYLYLRLFLIFASSGIGKRRCPLTLLSPPSSTATSGFASSVWRQLIPPELRLGRAGRAGYATPPAHGVLVLSHPHKAWGIRAGTQDPAVSGDLVCPSCSSVESSSSFVGAGCSARREVWVWAIFNCSPTPPQSCSSCHLRISCFSLVAHRTSLFPSPGWRSQRVGTQWNRLRAESGKSLGMVRSASTSPWRSHCYTGADLSREKEGSMVKAIAPLPSDPGL